MLHILAAALAFGVPAVAAAAQGETEGSPASSSRDFGPADR
jgi:hypothetical protein